MESKYLATFLNHFAVLSLVIYMELGFLYYLFCIIHSSKVAQMDIKALVRFSFLDYLIDIVLLDSGFEYCCFEV